MALLKLPLSVSAGGFFEHSKIDEDYLGSRLKVFILSGAGKFLVLPSPGIKILWMQLSTIGQTSKFCNKDVFPEAERRKLEEAIRREANSWLQLGKNTIKEVKILGSEGVSNGIKFTSDGFEFIFTFEFALSGKGLLSDAIGNWNILERVNVIH